MALLGSPSNEAAATPVASWHGMRTRSSTHRSWAGGSSWAGESSWEKGMQRTAGRDENSPGTATFS